MEIAKGDFSVIGDSGVDAVCVPHYIIVCAPHSVCDPGVAVGQTGAGIDIAQLCDLLADGSTSEAVNVDIASVVDMEENKWAVLGTYTVKIENEIMSAKFGLVATYDETSDKFIYSQEEFDDFK